MNIFNFKTPLQNFLSAKSVTETLPSLGLLLLRIAISSMMLTHGWYKFSNFAEMSQSFDPIGIGGVLSASLVIFAEMFCSILLILGLFTRLSVFPLIIAMGVAIFVAHSGQSFAAKELPLLYLTFYVVILIIGPGRYSIDRMLWK
ncbi:MAG: DoxX family protein [Bacteroidetes bacterium]|nr:DoxX family protein [Bacteroidota bacterium]